MKIEKFTVFINEALDFNDIRSNIKNTYSEIKIELIDKIENSLKEIKKENEINIIDVEDFIKDYISNGKESNLFDDLINDNDLFNFYLKYQSDIDKLLNEKKYMDKSPKEHNIFSLYDVIIDGTKQAILELILMLNKEIIKK
jgi:hypothetical protein